MSFSRSLRVMVLFVLAGCAANQQSPGGSAAVCGNGVGSANRQAPIICVDDSNRTLAVNPDPVTIHNVRKDDMASPVMVHWYTRSGPGDLQLELEEGCVAQVKCDGRGHCQARTEPKSSKTCKYDVWITGDDHDRLDPTIVLTNCCT